jgi:hypothetical protein
MKIWKPTKEEVYRIKRAAAAEGKLRLANVLLEPGIRYNTKDVEINVKASEVPKGMLNIALIQSADDPDWNNTDLEEYGTWSDFRAGVALTEDGRAIVDFYIRMRGDRDQSLMGNISVYYANGTIARIQGYPGEY